MAVPPSQNSQGLSLVGSPGGSTTLLTRFDPLVGSQRFDALPPVRY